jgi:hypothetical protein
VGTSQQPRSGGWKRGDRLDAGTYQRALVVARDIGARHDREQQSVGWQR